MAIRLKKGRNLRRATRKVDVERHRKSLQALAAHWLQNPRPRAFPVLAADEAELKACQELHRRLEGNFRQLFYLFSFVSYKNSLLSILLLYLETSAQSTASESNYLSSKLH